MYSRRRLTDASQLLRSLTTIRTEAAVAAQTYAQERLKTTDVSLLSNADQYRDWKETEVTRITDPLGTIFFLHELDTKVSSPTPPRKTTHHYDFRGKWFGGSETTYSSDSM